MVETPRLAVVIPCFNYAGFVGRAIASVVDQARADCEVVVVDDGSTDASWDVIRGFPGVTAIRTANHGALSACLTGLDATCAPHVLFLDADDELRPGSLEVIVPHLSPEVSKVQFALSRIDAEGRVVSGAIPRLEDYRKREELMAEIVARGFYKSPPTSGNVFRRDVCELLREVGYERNAVDGVTLYAAPFLGDVVSISAELGCYRIHGGNLSNIGGALRTDVIALEQRRLLAIADHLQEVVTRIGGGHRIVDPRDTFVFREREFFLEVASGRRPSLARLPRLLAKLAGDDATPKTKVSKALFFVAANLAPNGHAKALVAYRLKTGHRSIRSFLAALVRGGRLSAPSCPEVAASRAAQPGTEGGVQGA